MWDFIVKGGPVMVPIILASIVGLAIILEKAWFLKNIKVQDKNFIKDIFESVKLKNYDKANQICDENFQYPISAILKLGIEKKDIPTDRLEKLLEQEGNNQIQKMEKRLGGLATIISIEPLLGFLGTITGLISAFMSWEQAGANVTVNALAAGIYQAMITTAAGLIIAIPYHLCYNFFISKIKYTSNELNDYAVQFIDLVAEDKKAGSK